MSNKTQIEINEQNEAFMALVVELNMDMHENCAYNNCQACVGL